ncbi:uncharacterized protein I303_104877 [Kwoniella dejecticola CBS 10117]|uniref:Uncharacterized protein n=1 Tax=Kwoniella dejecticola CBS 10117 TaxID=1296121 RepID=A0A1A6A435_9TREE|nr:uncharacterized protein I303_04139 [Kwoniella dejecticola CBS 10117]OBR84818.1 hypothetical protein I303_04139 [Kwoniella dejecticola CBS 10117]
MLFTQQVTLLAAWGTLYLDLVLAAQRYDNAQFTIYYDIIQDCNTDTADGKSANRLNANANACGYSAEALGSSRIVAINADMFRPELCGTEVTIYRMDNNQPVHFSEGPLFVGDICPAGECAPDHIDIGSKAANDMNGSSGCKNPHGFAWELGDRIIGPPVGPGGSSLGPWKASQGQGQNQNSDTTVWPSISATSSSAPSSPTSWTQESTTASTSAASSWSADGHSSTATQNWAPTQIQSQTVPSSSSEPRGPTGPSSQTQSSDSSRIIPSASSTSINFSGTASSSKGGSPAQNTSSPPLAGGGKVTPLSSNLQISDQKVCRPRTRRKRAPAHARRVRLASHHGHRRTKMLRHH